MSLREVFLNSSSTNTSILNRIFDPAEGAVAKYMINRLDDFGCSLVDLTRSDNTQEQREFASDALYVPFTFNTNPASRHEAFTNIIRVDFSQDSFKAYISLFHEGVHALQWNAAPILHASPYNGSYRDQIVVCPQDWIRLVLITEQEAYAKQAWLTSLAANEENEFLEAAKANPVTPQRFREILSASDNLQSALIEAANNALANMHHIEGHGNLTTFGQYYVGNALQTYEKSLCLENPKNVTFVRMENEDTQPIGNTVGPNIIADGNISGLDDLEEFMTPALKERLNDLNKRLGITNEGSLPTFREAIGKVEHTPDSFMAWSKNPHGQYPQPSQDPTLDLTAA